MDDLLTRLEAYRTRWLIEETALGRLFVNDGKLLKDLRDTDREMRLATVGKIERFLAMTPQEIAAETGRPCPPGPDVVLAGHGQPAA